MAGSNPYEDQATLHQYLVFHYADLSVLMPWEEGPKAGWDYPAQCARLLSSHQEGRPGSRALDLGCAVGRSTFELSRHFREVVGLDFSRALIDAALELKKSGRTSAVLKMEGEVGQPFIATVPPEIDRARVHFLRGDACQLDESLGTFDAFLLANLIDRLPDPARCLRRLKNLARPGAVALITSPYTWMEEFTPRSAWLGGTEGCPQTLQGLEKVLCPQWELMEVRQLPFLIREHARKFQWSMAEASVWKLRSSAA